MTSRTELLTLRTGRRVAVESYGDPNGAPVFFFHGWPSSRLQGGLVHSAASSLGVRLLSLDRPGVGKSDYHRDRTLLDWPPLLAEVADRLSCEKFRLMAISGGGPYALAAAWAMPERVLSVALCCGAPPLAERSDLSALLPAYRRLLGLYRWNPEAMRHGLRMVRPLATIRPPFWLFRQLLKSLPAADATVLSDRATLDEKWEAYAEAWRGERDGVFGEARIYAQPWGFQPEDIRVPVRLWHGKEDANFDWALAAELAARIPGCRGRFLDDEEIGRAHV